MIPAQYRPRVRGRAIWWGTAVIILVLAGCGSGSRPQPAARHVETIPADGSFPPVTETVSGNTAAVCSSDADAFARSARMYLAHQGPDAAYPADLYYLGMRDALRDFRVRRCTKSTLGRVLARDFSKRGLHTLLAALPRTMAPAIRAGLTPP
jgi:hypothetical protein